MMARVLLLAIAALLASAGMPDPTHAEGEVARQEFLSWYNGYFNHQVWGLGLQWGANEGTFVQCGTRRIPVRAVYDTHTSREPPTAVQSKERLSDANLALLRSLETQGLNCAASKSPPQDP